MNSDGFLKFYQNKRTVVTGGGGFVGSQIVAFLKSAPANVYVPRTKDGIDFRNYDTCLKYLQETKPDIVINCAANSGGIGYHSGKQADLLMDNLLMGVFLMKAAQAVGVTKFVNVIAGCSYPGYLDQDVMNEEDYWSGPIHESIFSFGFPRKASAVYGLALQKQYDFHSIHLVMANMYGPREHFIPEQSKALAGLVKKFYEAKKQGLPSVELWGTGKPVRDWLFVRDGAEGILRAGAVYDDVEPMNIATGVGISVNDLAAAIQKIIGYQDKITHNTSKPDGALHKTFGIAKMKSILDWVPQTPIERGIQETVDWFDQNYEYAITH